MTAEGSGSSHSVVSLWNFCKRSSGDCLVIESCQSKELPGSDSIECYKGAWRKHRYAHSIFALL